MPTRTELIAQARTWIDVPAISGGSQRCGVNCLGIFVGILRELGGFESMIEEMEKHVGFKKPTTPGDLLRKLLTNEHWQSVRPTKFQPGNVILFFTRDGPQHLAMVTEPGIILHASQNKKKVVEHSIPEGWRVAGEFKFKGLDD